MNIVIIAVGKIREKFIKAGIEEFLKRIQPYSSIKVVEIDAESLRNDCAKSIEIEGEKILNRIPDFAYVITLDISGKALDSGQFASKIKEINIGGTNQLVFVIGGATGLADKVKNRADFSLSLSKMTFPHQFARLMLIEQIYRAFKIMNNEPYHK
jgi:23S rRNA (pseudouridine1915-N3)-methyltransferase